jgi:hypothetical protein
MGRLPTAGLGLVMALVLGGCAGLTFPGAPAPAAQPPAASPARPVARPAARAVVDPVSADLAAFYARLERDRRARGLMRTDDGTRDIPVSAGRLARIWTSVALRDEYVAADRTRHGGASVLRRFELPVVYRLEFGPSVPPSVQAADRARVADLVTRMSEAARHPMRLAPAGESAGNFHVLVLSEAERRAIGPRLRELVPGIGDAAVRLITDLPRETLCIAVAFARGGGSVYTESVAVIRAEHPDLTRLACYHEELAQGLGLAADDPSARPSVFNDDQEFALLTRLDLLMLRLHYDPRLRPGMSERVAAPIAFTIASELASGDS